MKLNKKWKPQEILCPKCSKWFEVTYELEGDDNCEPIISSYNLKRIYSLFCDKSNELLDKKCSMEDVLDWLNILRVVFECPHCKHVFKSNATCRVCHKPLSCWMGQATGLTCGSDDCAKISNEWLKKGGIPRSSMSHFSNDKVLEVIQKNKWGLK